MILTEILEDSGLQYWIYVGMHDQVTEGKWKTSESDYRCAAQFIDWYPAQPNNANVGEDCAAMKKYFNWKWHDVPCTYMAHSVCQVFE